MDYFEIHRHDQFSLFDGFGSAEQVAKRAKELEYEACGLTNHGNITGLVKHFKACNAENINPILGLEAYFQPKIDNNKKSYHLCLYATSMKGWENLNKLISVGNQEDHFYYKNKIDFKDLAKYNKGLLCSSACIAGPISMAFRKGRDDVAEKLCEKFIDIFGDRFFLEIQPIEIHGPDAGGKGSKNLQMQINEKILALADKMSINVICTSDSHFVYKEDFPTYLKLHAIKNSTIGEGYSERYMPSKEEMEERITKYHKDHKKDISRGMKEFLKMVGDSRDWFKFEPNMPRYTEDPEETFMLMKRQAIKFLKDHNKFDKKYQDKLKFEFDVITYHGFQDYFMVVQDYVNWAKRNGIAVGPGRGSAGNSLTNYALGITLVDPIIFNNDFDRFLRKDKKKFPDIDCDFCKNRRNEVIQYIINKYQGKAAQTLTYGKYNLKNLINDLVKVCGCEDKKEVDDIKKFLSKYCNDNENTIDMDGLESDPSYDKYNALYDNIIIHFVKMYGQVRYFGTHASSVILCSSDITKKAGLMRTGGNLRTSFDLHDIEYLGLLKLDILGLSSASQAHDLEEITGEKFRYSMLNDKATLKQFNTDATGIFQFETRSSLELIKLIGVNSFEDIVASVALNRPGPLTLGMHEQYADNKQNIPTDTPWYKYTKQSYGTLIYQEQAMAIAREIGGYDPSDADKIAKYDANHIPEDEAIKYRKMFVKNAVKNGLEKEQANELFDSMLGYSFNRGHAVAYAMLSAELGYFKAHYPDEFWYITLKYEWKEESKFRDEALYIREGGMIMLPHVNGPVEYDLIQDGDEKYIQKGTLTIKNVGEKAARFIYDERMKNGDFKDIDDFIDRCKCRTVTTRVIDALEDAGALCFNKKKFLNKVRDYNIGILSRDRG